MISCSPKISQRSEESLGLTPKWLKQRGDNSQKQRWDLAKKRPKLVEQWIESATKWVKFTLLFQSKPPQMSCFNINPRRFSMILAGDCHRLFHYERPRKMGRGREKDCNPESISMAPGLRKALRMVLIEKGLHPWKTKQGSIYVILERLFTEDREWACYIHNR